MDVETAIATFHNDMTIVAPFNPDCLDVVQSVYEGKEECSRLYEELPKIAAPLDFSHIDIQPLQAPGRYVATYQGNSRLLLTGLPYRNRYISLFTVRDGRILNITEHFNPYVLLTSMGWTFSPPATQSEGGKSGR